MKAIFVIAIASQLGLSSANAQSLRIAVVDESGAGVLSRIYYEEAAQPRPFWNTDPQGKLVRPHACGKTRTLKAAPADAGSYFESQEEPCSGVVTLRVLKRKTPIGTAFAYKIAAARLPDGSPAIVKFSTVLDTRVSPSGPSGQQCDVQLSALVEQEVFRVDGVNWIPVTREPTRLSNVIAEKTQPDAQHFAFDLSCAANAGRIETLQVNATSLIRNSLTNAPSIKAEAFRDLGVQNSDWFRPNK